jgi:alpha 1,3-glucosidase
MEIRETHSVYGLLQTIATYKGELNRDIKIGGTPKRPFVLTRSFYAGSQRYAWSWTGDNRAEWGQLRNSLAMVMVLGLNSMPFTGEDLGAGGDPPQDLLVRWYQMGTWVYPFMRSHCGDGAKHREPWVFPSPTMEQLNKTISNRYVLTGLWYTHSVYATRNGRSPIVPLWLEWPEVDGLHDIDNEGLLGDSLLVAPVTIENATSVRITKPPGVWYNFWNGDVLREDVNVSVTMDDVPVFVRGGRIVPLYRKHGETTFRTIVTPLTLLIAVDGSGEAEGSIYLDDGETFGFEEGKYVHRNFTFSKGVLSCKKGDTSEKEIPVFLRDNIVSDIEIYRLRPDGSSEVDHIEGLHLKLCEEWKWSETSAKVNNKSKLVVKGRQGRKGKTHGNMVPIVSAICLSVIVFVVTIVSIIVVKSGNEEAINEEHIGNSVEPQYT